MLMGDFAVSVGILAVVECGVRVLFGFVVFAVLVKMGRLSVVVCGRLVLGRGILMVFERRMLLFPGHGDSPVFWASATRIIPGHDRICSQGVADTSCQVSSDKQLQPFTDGWSSRPARGCFPTEFSV
jgi:hypothetical protein